MEKLIASSLHDFLFEGVKDDVIAMAKKRNKENSPEFKKLMAMLDKDRGLMVVFTKWLLGIPAKDPRNINNPEQRFALERVRPAPIEELAHLYNQAKLLGLQNIKKDLNSFKNSEEFGDYLTKEIGDKRVKDILSITTKYVSREGEKLVGIPSQVKEMIRKNEKIYNLFRNNLDHIETLAEYLARKGANFKNEQDLYEALSKQLQDLDNFNKEYMIAKIKNFNLRAQVINVNAPHLLLLYVEDAVASANLGSQEWCISEAEGFPHGHETIQSRQMKETNTKLLQPTSAAKSRFDNTYQLSKYKKMLFLI